LNIPSLNLRGTLLSLHDPIVMGIVNLDPNSFFSGSRVESIGQCIAKVAQMLADGMAIVDLGAMTSRPGSKVIDADIEAQVLEPYIRGLQEHFPTLPISVDTLHHLTAARCLDLGVHMINDISGGVYDADMYQTVAAYHVPYIAMHMQGTPETMQLSPLYQDVVSEVAYSLAVIGKQARDAGIKDVILDPGIGFGKTIAHNFQLIKNLDIFSALGFPILLGISRKSFLYKSLNTDADSALNATTATHMYALQKGVNILRVHDVKEAVECIKIYKNLG
jgi:dihydropteroate synthase